MVELVIFGPNWEAVEVFQLCEMTLVGGMSVSWHGISAQEIRAAFHIVRVPRSKQAEVADKVKYMGSVVAKAMNEKVSAEIAKGKGPKK